jgi:hypothetical protein
MQKIKFFFALVSVALVLGIFSAYADGWYGNYWQSNKPFVESLLLLTAGVIGNAAGVWALLGVGASYFTSRKYGFWYGMAASAVLLLVAVMSYYLTIAVGSLRPESDLLPTFIRWLIVAGVITIPCGLAGSWLANDKGIVRQALATASILAYTALDLLLLYTATADVKLEIIALAVVYTFGIGFLLFHTVRVKRAKVAAVALAIFVFGACAGLLFWPVITDVANRVQHGEPQPYDDSNTIYVN